MFKKALSLLLALMLVVASFSVAMISVAASDEGAGSSDGLTVNATSNIFADKTVSFTKAQLDASDKLVKVTFNIESAWRMVNADWLLTYDGAVLEFDEAANTSGDKLTVMPVVDESGMSPAVINTKPTSVEYGLKGNCTDLHAYYLNSEGGGEAAFVSVIFKVIGSGDTTVDLQVSEMKVTEMEEGQSTSDTNKEVQFIENGALGADAGKVNFSTSTSVTLNGEVPPTEPTQGITAAPSTAPATEPTTEPVGEDTYIVAGSPADIFGTAWDGTNEENLMTKNDDGTYSKDYTVTKEFKAVQLKTVKNGAEWIGDKNDQNVTFNLTGAGTFTVVYDTAENYTYVKGDIVEEIKEFKYDTVFAVGNGEGTWLNGAAWDPAYAANEMTKVADDLWEIEFKDVPDGFNRQLKFAIDGAWTHNFGGAFEESGVTSAAAYNGDNVTFDTDDTCTIKAQLDLREFDFATKEGAKFTVTITSDEPEKKAIGIIGDVDGDGQVTINDATEIQKRGVELVIFDEKQEKLADVNGDKRISILDVTCIQKYLAEQTEGIGNTGKTLYDDGSIK